MKELIQIRELLIAIRRSIVSLCAIILLALGHTVFAQEVDGASSEEQTSSEDIEEVVVLGQSQRDSAMSAFRSGDFETAEKNFLINAKCALRRERSLESLVENQTIGIERATTNQNAQSIGGGTSAPPPGAAQAAAAAAGASQSPQGSVDNRAQESAEFTCDNRGFQLYMAGLSQIQLGNPEEALTNFKRAVSLSRSLYDAHYRIGLISLLNKDIPESRQQLKKIAAILKKCKKKCSVKKEIEERYQHLKISIEQAQT